jgi:hypothetical protein
MKPRERNVARLVLTGLAACGLAMSTIVGILNIGNPDPDRRAVVYMGLSLIAVWCMLGGTTMYLGKRLFIHWSRSLKVGWKVRFVLLAALMALIEEAIATSLTNAAPVFGAISDSARITVSANYFEVISTSVVAFIPWFLCWAWLLGRFDFKPLQVVLCLGLTGAIAEAMLDATLTLDDLAGACMWVFVYGLMVYLPAAAVPEDHADQPPPWFLPPLVVVLPLVFVIPLVLYLPYALARAVAVRAWRGFGGS